MSEGSAKPGEQVELDLSASDIGSPGLGAWSIDISYDPDVVTPVGCDTEHGAVCNLHFSDDEIRTAGATAVGFEGDVELAHITFECADDEGESPITVSLPDFADATLGGPVQIAAEIEHGKVTCTNTPIPQPPTTGTGGSTTSDDGNSYLLLIGLLAVAGVTALAGFGVLRARASRN
jgi:hypothetical protein